MTRERPTTVSALMLRPIAAGLRSLGIEPYTVLERAGIEPSLLGAAEARVPRHLMTGLWEGAVLASGRDDFGLLAANGVEPSAFDVMGYLAASSATVGDALERVRRFVNLITNAVQLELEQHGQEARLVLASLPVPRAVTDFRVALLIRVSRQVLDELAPRRVELRHPRPSSIVSYAESMGIVPIFSSSEDAVVFSSEVLALPMPAADAVLCRILQRQAEGMFERLRLRRVPSAIACCSPRCRSAFLPKSVPSRQFSAWRGGTD